MPNQPPSRRRRLQQEANLPLLSGKATALVVFLLLLLTAILIPVASGLPVWVEAGIVLAAWWLIWVSVLTYLLYHRHQLSHDFEAPEPRSWLPALTRGDWGGPRRNSPEGCANTIAVFLVAALAVGIIWFIVEVTIPIVAFLVYLLVRGMLARVANDSHNCEGRLARSLFWAMAWATLYTAPLALVVWFVHWWLTRQAV